MSSIHPNHELLHRRAEIRPRLAAPLNRYLKERARTAAYLTFQPDPTDDPLATKLAGAPYIVEGELWPVCDRCGDPLHHLFQVNFAALGFPAIEGAGLLTFFYCIGCSPEDHTQPGWTVWLRESTTRAAVRLAPPPVPLQAEQPLPIILLTNQAHAAAVRIGPDLPAPFDPELRAFMGSLTGDSRLADALDYGCTRYARIGIRSRETGEESELVIPMTPKPSPFDQEPPPPDLFPHHELLYLEVRPIPEPAVKNPWGQYDRYMRELHQGEERPLSKVGGWCNGTQEPRFTHCGCGEPLDFILQIGTTNHTPFVVGDLGGIYLAGCRAPGCSEKRLTWWVDWS